MSQEKPLISIGIPFFNAEKYLALAIQSVLHQTYTHWELHLVGDGSSDHSLNIAKAYEVKDARIKVISDGENHGLPARLNELSDIANGCFYCRMDADDMMFPNRLENNATVNSIKIFWKNLKILGFFNSVTMTLTSIIKLIIYIVFWALGKTSKLIIRRSQDLKINKLNYHQKVINKMFSMDLLNGLKKLK